MEILPRRHQFFSHYGSFKTIRFIKNDEATVDQAQLGNMSVEFLLVNVEKVVSLIVAKKVRPITSLG